MSRPLSPYRRRLARLQLLGEVIAASFCFWALFQILTMLERMMGR